MFVGLVAALLSFGFASALGEQPIGHAIGFEEQQAQSAGEVAEPELVSRPVQRTFGLLLAVAMYGVAFGGLFGIAVAVAWGRLGRLGARATAGVIAMTGFVVVGLMPFLKYPPNPPAVGNPDTIGRRTLLYLAVIGVSVIAALAAAQLGRQLKRCIGPWNAVLAAVGGFVALMALAQVLLPPINEVPADFPATVLWRFRIASLGTQAVVWVTFGLLFGTLTERQLLRREGRPVWASRASGAKP